MVEIIGASDAAAFAILGRNIARGLVNVVPVAGTSQPRTLALPRGTVLRPSLSGELSINLQDVKRALDLALKAGGAVLNTLRALKIFTDIADHDSLVSSEAGIAPGGTRLSRTNLSSQARLALRRLNVLIDKANLAGANFISSKGRTVSVITSSFGGKIAIRPQPLDTVGLGLDDFSLQFDSDVNKAVSSISEAITLAEIRIERLLSLQNALANPIPFDANLARVVSNGQSSTLPRGSLVNLFG